MLCKKCNAALLERITFIGPFKGSSMYCTNDSAVTLILGVPLNGHVDIALEAIACSPHARGEGRASAVLRELLEAANEDGTTIGLHVEPLGNKGLGKSELESWYKRYGFKPEPDSLYDLVYTPPPF